MFKRVTKSRRWNALHGIALYAGIQAATFSLYWITKKARDDDQSLDQNTKDYYNNQILPFFAPPDWLFAPAWTINNALCVYGLLRVLNLPENTLGRREFINLQIASWATFTVFSAAAFGLRSNANSAILTNFYFAFTLASLYVALVKLKDAKTALSLSTLTIWLALASALSISILISNGDDFYRIEAFAKQPGANQIF